jgi:hypothetical protein
MEIARAGTAGPFIAVGQEQCRMTARPIVRTPAATGDPPSIGLVVAAF